MSTCPKCSTAVEKDWLFCRNCGGSLSASDAATEQLEIVRFPNSRTQVGPKPERDPVRVPAAPRAPAWRRRALVILGLVIAVGLLVEGGYLHFQVRERLEQRSTQLVSTQGELSQRESELAETTDALATMTTVRDGLRANIKELRRELKGVRGSLDEAQTRLELQASEIQNLKTCLNGVAIAFDDVLYGDYSAAASALVSVQGACEQAFALF